MSLVRILARSVDLIPWRLRNRIKSIPGVASFQRCLVNRVMVDKEFVHTISAGPASGLNFRVRLPDDKLYWTGTWEHDITTTIAAQVRPGLTCLDVGAHRGFMAGVMARNGASRVICFEPNPDNAAAIADLVSLNPNLPIEVMALAVGAEDALAQFEIMPESSMGKLSTSTFQNEETGARTIDVTIRTLDGLVAEGALPIPGFLKIDIEGAELDALYGAAGLIESHHPTLLIEAHSYDLLHGCADWLRDRGYSLSVIQTPLEGITPETFKVCHLLAQPA
ncbi:hypothetical protein C1J05_06005 [Sulfitobacter sp. JL08]|uniref:FkbM family methyltransferase n=1 Tax=Sulfitobacter sp. JL08 TaxID=2070369 RepID=UPI000E09E857|nr:FkbM family methyltransferase [Sulfitobacter sp. JL08]AXI54101.1 hypothetical protein C1J05_06005 [Sulfitobacter sp. JL08]